MAFGAWGHLTSLSLRSAAGGAVMGSEGLSASPLIAGEEGDRPAYDGDHSEDAEGVEGGHLSLAIDAASAIPRASTWRRPGGWQADDCEGVEDQGGHGAIGRR